MMKTIRQFFAPPVFPDDEDKTSNARVLYTLLACLLAVAVLDAIVVLFIAVRKTGALMALFILLTLILVSYALVRRGHVRLASVLFVTGMWMIFTFVILLTGRITTAIVSIHISLAVIAGILLGRYSAVSLAALSCGGGLGLAILENAGYPIIHYFPAPPLVSWIVWVFAFVIALTALNLTLQSSAQALALARKSEVQFRLLAENSTDMISRHDIQGAYLYASPACRRLLGYEPEELIGHSAFEFIHPDDVPTVEQSRTKIIAQPLVSTIVFRVRCKNGDYTWLETNSRTIFDQAGNAVEIHAASRDVTERKQGEEINRKAFEHLQAMLNALPDLLFEVDIEGRFYDYRAPREALYVPPEFFLGKTLSEVMPAEVSQVIMQAIAKAAAAGGHQGATYSLQMPDETRWYEMSIAAKGGLQNRFIILVRDITERKKAEEALCESEEKFRILNMLVPAGIYLTDPEGNCSYTNQRWNEMAGFISSQEALGKGWINAIHPDDREIVFSNWKKTIESEGHWGKEYRFCTPEGKVTWVYGLATPQKDASGKTVRYIGLNTDITEIKQAEERIKKSLAEKETLLRELYHRTKNNMNVIIALLDMQSSYFEEERLQAAFIEAQNRIHSMALVHQKLYEARDLSHINLKDYIDNLAALLMTSYHVASGRVSIVYKMESVLVLIETAIHCGLILNELISNALKYAFPVGRNGTITVELHRMESGEIQLNVSDDGIGLPPGFDVRRDGHLGLKIIYLIGEKQLKARVSFSTELGVSCRLQFKDNLYHPRV